MDTQVNTPGKGLLIAAGVLMLIFGTIELISTVILSNTSFSARIALERVIGMQLGTIVFAGFLSAFASIALGIVAFIYCGKPDKAKYLFLEGIGVLVFQIILIIAFSRHMGLNILSFLGPAVIVLFIIGAKINKNAHAE